MLTPIAYKVITVHFSVHVTCKRTKIIFGKGLLELSQNDQFHCHKNYRCKSKAHTVACYLTHHCTVKLNVRNGTFNQSQANLSIQFGRQLQKCRIISPLVFLTMVQSVYCVYLNVKKIQTNFFFTTFLFLTYSFPKK